MSPLLSLIKYKLCLAVTLTGMAGYIIYKGNASTDLLLVAGGIFLLAGGASALNQYQERKFDTLMNRTRTRPIPSGAIPPGAALIISLSLILAGAGILLFIAWLPSVLGLLNIILYNIIYTKLKRASYLAILPGALVGAIPPLIGWTAAGGSISSPTILFLASLVFMWQIPHFWLLIIRYNKEYEDAGFKTLLRIFDEAQVKRIVFVWITISSLFAMTYFYFGIEINIVFIYIILAANILFIFSFYWLLFRTKEKLRTAFILSNIFITSIFIILAAGSII